MRNILFVDINENHLLSIHLPESVVETSIPYLQIQGMLEADDRFMECHHRIIINMEHVRRMDREIFILKDGTKVPISKRKLREAKAAYQTRRKTPSFSSGDISRVLRIYVSN